MSTSPSEARIPEWTRGDRYRKAREVTGLTVRDFAQRIGVSHGTVSNAEGNKHGVRKIVTNAWSLATGVPVEWLETGIAPSQPSPGDGGQESTHLYPRLSVAGRPSAAARYQVLPAAAARCA